MNLDKIKNNLKDTNVIYYKTIDSTQKRAKELYKENVPNKTLVLTDNQTNGIGTHGRVWQAQNNCNILMTLIMYSNCNISKLKNITVNIANCLIDTIKELYDIDLSIKEPNDLILNGKKIGGILTETKLHNEFVKTIFIGIGFNVNQETFPAEIANIATSLKREYNKTFKREEIIVNFIKKLTLYLNKLQV